MKVKEYQKLPTFLKIKENAVFVADAHYNTKRDEFLVFLEKLKTAQIHTTQLFLMGDMFDFLAGDCTYFIKINKKIINIINDLSNTLDIIYFEGNHDYNLKIIFPNINIISRDNQPLYATYNEKNVALSHGDIYVNDSFYEIYCKIIRNKPLLKLLNIIDFNGFLSKKINNALLDKSICAVMENFESIVKKRLKHYDCDMVIEGHFHQGNEYIIDNKRYKNIASLTCSKEYNILKDGVFVGESIE